MDRQTCLHCKRNVAIRGKRMLCQGCYCDVEIRNRYPRYCKAPQPEQTEAELDQLIAKVLANPPKWWKGECARESRRWGPRVPRILANVYHDGRR